MAELRDAAADDAPAVVVVETKRAGGRSAASFEARLGTAADLPQVMRPSPGSGIPLSLRSAR